MECEFHTAPPLPTGAQFLAPIVRHFAPAPSGPAFGASHLQLISFDAPAAQPTGLQGSWTRNGMTIDCHDGRICVKQGDETFAHGVYHTSADGLLFGVVEEILYNPGPDADCLKIPQLIDQPFAIRFRLDDRDLIIKDIRCAGLTPAVNNEESDANWANAVRAAACGRYTAE